MAHTTEGKGLQGLSTTGRTVVNSIYADSDGAALKDLIQVCLSEGLKTLEMPASTFTATLAPRGYSEWSLAEVCAAFDFNHQDKVSLRRLMLEEMVASVSLRELNFESAELYNSWLEKRIRQVFALYDVEDRGEIPVPQFCFLTFDMVQSQGGREDFYTIENIVQSMTNEITVSYDMFSEAVMLNVFGEFGINIEPLFPYPASTGDGDDEAPANLLLSRSRSFPSQLAPVTSTSTGSDSGGEVPSFRVQWNTRQVESSPEVHLGRMSSSDISPTAMAPLTHGLSGSLTAIRSAVPTTAVEVADRVLAKLWETIPVMKPQWKVCKTFIASLVPVDDLQLLCEEATKIIQSQEMVVDVEAPAKVFGDIHGQFCDVLLLFKMYGIPDHHGGDVESVSYVFNGDFVDRGNTSCEVVVLLLCLKCKYPDRVWLIRGNHEDPEVNEVYGWPEECRQKYGPVGGPLFRDLVNAVFAWLPLGAVIEKKIFCLHGGLGRGTLTTIEQIKGIPRPIYDSMADELVMDILWSDPIPNDGVKGVHANPRGGDIVEFGPDLVQRFCMRNDLNLIIRSHQPFEDGYMFFARGHLASVFSARDYCGQCNDGALLFISRAGKITPKVIKARPNVDPQQYPCTRDASPVRRRNDFADVWTENNAN